MADFLYTVLVIVVGVAALMGVLYVLSGQPAREHFAQQRKRDGSCAACPLNSSE
jgi:hypothetical protein